MLKSLRLRNFKSFADAQADFGPLTLLVGANAAGKSNVLEAIRLLQGLGRGRLSLEWVLQGKRSEVGTGWPGIRGGLHEVVREGADSFAIDSSWHLAAAELEHSIQCQVSPRPLIRGEIVREAGAPTPIFEATLQQASAQQVEAGETREPSAQLTLFLEGVRREDMARVFSARASFLTQVMDLLVPTASSSQHALLQLYLALVDVQFLDMVPAAMRRYVPREMQEMGESGENLSAVLWRLCQDAERKQELVTWLDELCTPELADIEFSSTDEGDVMLRLVEKDGSRVSARSLSDGTLRFLGELVALRTAPEGSVILMEELGNGLHPRRIHLLVEYLEAITEERNIQVIATTHSPLVLQALGRRARGDVVLLGRTPEAQGTVMRRLGELPGFEEAVERRGMEYLFTTGWLEQAL